MKAIQQAWLILFLFSFSFCAAAMDTKTDDSAAKIKWGYVGNTGPAKWGNLDKHFASCATGKTQSPINLNNRARKAAANLNINYNPATMAIVDDGTTSLLLGHTQTIIRDGHSVQLNFNADRASESVDYDGKTYRLVQFHLHTPSENLWFGRAFPMEIHFVHQGDNGRVLVIAVWVKIGKANSSLQQIINHLPKEENKEMIIEGQNIQPENLLPQKHRFYSFMGSLTTPPCTEGLQWIMLREPITASPSQIMQLRHAANGANARPIQRLYGRSIYYTDKIKENGSH